MRRGEIWTAAGGPDYAGKPRPTLILQSDLYQEIGSITVCGLTSDPTPTNFARPLLHPEEGNGLREASRVMVDKVMTVPRGRLRERIGALDGAYMAAIDQALLLFLGLADPPRATGA